MSILTWIVVGLVAGFLASKFVIRSDEGLLRDLGLGIVGAAIGGWLAGAMTSSDATGLNVFALVVTLAGAGAALVAYHVIFPHPRQG